MIISHKHKFIFIKTFKVSGTSMEIALSRYIGNEDILTPLNLEDEIKRYKKTGALPQNYSKNKLEEIKYKNYIKKLSKKKISKKILNELEKKKDGKFKSMIYYNHISAVKVKKLIKKKIWKKYFKFTIERNPYDKVISFMYFANRFKKIKNVKNEIDKTIRLKKYLNYPIYTNRNKKILVNYILDYGSIKKNVKFLESKLNLELNKFYIKTKNSTRKDKRHYRDILTFDQMKKIKNDANLEFQIMKYK